MTWTRQWSRRYDTRAQTAKDASNLDFIRMEELRTSEDIIKRVKRQASELENIFENHT